MDAQQLENLFHQARGLAVDAQAPFLDNACGDNAELRHRLERLLAASQEAENSNRWEMPAIVHEASTLRRTLPKVDRYRLIELIGAGGMGMVYRAVRADDAFWKIVAVKIVHAAGSDQNLINRFCEERRILAVLEHPNIVRLLDGGVTADGRPFLVMEFVEGLPLAQFAAEKRLSIREILLLFRKVCSAVAYAHHNLIVHRDLKPANILITADGEPKLLDFGIARLMDDPSVQTQTGGRGLTPRYASPEQIRGDALTTATDVYSLGVVLFELLSGHSPYRSTSNALELAEAIAIESPPVMSEVSGRLFDRDLENILQMALRKEPSRRYESVEQFSEDIRRYLEGQPVAACGNALSYRTARFATRYRVGLAVVGLIIAILVAGIFETSRARAAAEGRFRDVRSLANWVLFDFEDSIAQVPGTLEARQKMVRRSVEYLDRLSAEEESEPELLSELQVAYDRVGSLTFGVDSALASHRKAVAIGERLVRSVPDNMRYQRQLAASLSWVSAVLRERGNLSEAISGFQRAAKVLGSVAAREPGDPEVQAKLAEIYETLGQTLVNRGDPVQALVWEHKAESLASAIYSARPGDHQGHRAVMISRLCLAEGLLAAGDRDRARQYVSSALDQAQRSYNESPANAERQRDLWLAHLRSALIDEASADFESAAEHLKKALPLIQGLVDADPGDEGHQHGISNTYLAMGRVQAARRRYADAADSDRRALEIAQAVLARDPGKTECLADRFHANLQLALLEDTPPVHLDTARKLFAELAARQPENASLALDRVQLEHLTRK